MVLPPNRRQPLPEERQASINAGLVLGALQGRVPQAAPVSSQQRAAAQNRAAAAVSTPPHVWRRDRFPESGELASVPATLDLTALPLPITPVVVALNGIVADEGTDYTVSGKTVTVLAAWDVQVGDVVDVRYPYLSGMPDVPAPLLKIIVPFGATGWRYKQIARTDATDYSAVGYDDSAWAAGSAAFGTGVPGDSSPAPTTAWSAETRLWLRRIVPAGSDFAVKVRVDDVAEVYWNGQLIASHTLGGGTLESDWLSVPAAAVSAGPQTVAFRATDTSSSNKSYIDAQIRGALL